METLGAAVIYQAHSPWNCVAPAKASGYVYGQISSTSDPSPLAQYSAMPVTDSTTVPFRSTGFVIIKDKAEQTLHNAGVWEQIPVPLNRVAESLGYICMDFDSSGDVAAVSGAVDYKQRTIWVNKTESPVRKRFTIAHEIGHAVLHPEEDIVDYRTNFEKPLDRKEVEANKFAAELLMPEEFFRASWGQFRSNMAVALIFGVSEAAASYRAQNLGLFS